MSTEETVAPATRAEQEERAQLLQPDGSRTIPFAGTDSAFYEPHLVFDNVVDLTAAGPRERGEAIARSVRDGLSQRWIRTQNINDRESPKRVYSLSMEFYVVGSGKFSSDRTIAHYAAEIGNAKPCVVE